MLYTLSTSAYIQPCACCFCLLQIANDRVLAASLQRRHSIDNFAVHGFDDDTISSASSNASSSSGDVHDTAVAVVPPGHSDSSSSSDIIPDFDDYVTDTEVVEELQRQFYALKVSNS
jgi:hypothetical protein